MIDILWDASHLWGYLLMHAVHAAGLPCRLLKGPEIAQGGLSGKVLLVPGGSARGKAESLGRAGLEALRDFVGRGGHYLGFCGGAGLALAGGAGLCPWSRASIADRLQHHVSGRVECEVLKEHSLVPERLTRPLLPVWWPGRFEEVPGRGVEVLARYCAPGPDLYVADMPLSRLPEEVLADWRNMYGVNLRPSLLDAQPCVISGRYGEGTWVLSYSHLETPGEETDPAGMLDANRWLFHLLEVWTGERASCQAVPPWRPAELPVHWEDRTLLDARRTLEDLLDTARVLGQLFRRTSWLLGWRAGMPGAQLNGLRVALGTAVSLYPSNARLARWREREPEFRKRFALFEHGARSWLLARRLADTLDDSLPGMLPKALLVDQKELLFGSPMAGGGLCGQLQEELESLLF